MKRRSVLQSLIAASAVAFAQEPDFTLRSNVRLVLLDVSVRNKRGAFVSGLVKDNFSLLEDGHKQPITVFAHDDLPITAGLLVDESSSMRHKRAEVLNAADVFIAESNPRDEVFVLSFNDEVFRGLPPGIEFTDNREKLHAALRRGQARGKTALNDAIAEGLEQLKKGRRERKALVVISDGGDNASHATRREIFSLVQRSSATIYTIGIYDEGESDRDPGFLHSLASISGGDMFLPKDTEAMPSVCKRIADDIRSRYTLGYVPEQRHNASGLRRIAVHVSDPSHGRLTALTRTSYSYEI